MSHSKDRQETRNKRWQQRQREGNQEQMNPRSPEPHTQGEHSGQQRYGREMDNRSTDWDSHSDYSRRNNGDGEPYGSYYNPRQPQESWSDPRAFRSDSNREWVSGTEDAPHRVQQSGPEYGTRNYSQDNRAYRDPRQSFAGRGPQGYKRSDERITEDINEEMTRAHDLDPTNISVETKNGEVVLKGTVSDRESKRRAEEIAESCSGVQDVQNQIRVKRESVSDSANDSRHDRGEDRSGDKRSKIAS